MAEFTLEEIKKLKSSVSPLEKYVLEYLESEWEDYDDPTDWVKEVLENGCSSGIVTDLIYYEDTVAFYKKYQKDINELVYDCLIITGLSLSDLNGWDEEDPLALEDSNQNTLAWFGFEETLRSLCKEYFSETFEDYI